MPTRSIIAAALCVAVLGFSSYRNGVLERRIETLKWELEDNTAPPDVPRARFATENTEKLNHRQRITALEEGVASVSAAIRTLEYATRAAPHLANPQTGQEIISVVKRENSRVRDLQLDWSSTRWREARDGQLALFARDHGLTADQTATLRRSLATEIEAMVEVLKRPNLFEEPERTARDWQALLEVTDRDAERILTPAQLDVWKQVRAFERKLLWPWLPETK